MEKVEAPQTTEYARQERRRTGVGIQADLQIFDILLIVAKMRFDDGSQFSSGKATERVNVSKRGTSGPKIPEALEAIVMHDLQELVAVVVSS
jgi:hypothetical protein